MSIKSYNEIYSLSDHALVEEIGAAIRRIRLNQNYSQQELANNSGLDRITISKLENGRPATMLTIVQVLRALQRLDVLFTLINEPSLLPGLLQEPAAEYKRRASHPRKSPKNLPPSEW